MDQAYLEVVLEKLKRMREVHDQRFADNPHHHHCLPRIDRAIAHLSADATTVHPAQRLDFSPSESALPDAILPAASLQQQAQQLEAQDNPASVRLRQESRNLLFKELNELDGFDR